MRETLQDLNLLTVAVALGVAAMLATGAVIGTQGQTLTAQDGPDTDTSPETDGEFENDSAGSVSPDEVDDRSARETERGDDTDTETRVTVSGTLEASAGEDYRLDGLAIDIGAEWYTSTTTAETDLDGDGTVETIRAEFDGLVGQTVTLTVETDGTEGDVFAVDGEQYRERGPPPWAGGPHGNGPPDHAGP
jgi:hypothetical protein